MDYTQYYADGSALTGIWAEDSVCMTNDVSSCVSTFEFVAVYDDNNGGLGTTIDGVIGL